MDVALKAVNRLAEGGDELPERLDRAWFAIATLDVVAALGSFVITWALLRDARSALIALATVLAIAWMTGRYRRSFAVLPVDEIYSTGALVLEAVAVLVIVVPVFSAAILPVALALALWTVAAAYGTMWLCRQRRGASPRRRAEAPRVDPVGRMRARSPVLQFQLRCADLVIASIATVVLAPVLAIVALLVARDSGRPVIFRQQRAGSYDRDFTMLKFRTMKSDAGDAWVTPGDDRITRVGTFLRKSSLDELPQLWNVLAGDMSLVGPRPEMSDYADRFSREASNYPDRHILRPGITGWAQLYCPRNLLPSDMPDVLKHDLFYIQNAGLHLYLFCIVKTALELFSHNAV